MATIASISALLTLDGQDFAKQAAKSTAEARNFALNLAAQNETMGMSANAAKLYALEQKGADASVIATARAVQQQVDAMERFNAETLQAQAATQRVRTDFEKLEQEVAQLDQLWHNGRITAETYNRTLDLLSGTTARLNADMAAAARITANAATPFERLEQEVSELDRLMSAGLITQQTYNRELDRLSGMQDRANAEIAEARRVFDAVTTPAERYQYELRDLNRLLVNGRITQETHTRAVQAAQARYQQAIPPVDNFARSLARARAQLNDVGSSFLRTVPGISAFTGALAAAFAAVVSINTAKNVLGHGIKLAADYEQATVALNTMLGDMGKAKKLLADLNDFAKATPFEMPELTSSTKKLVAFGIEQEKILPTLKSLGDVASGVSMSIDELAELYGKARVQGRLFMEDINQLTNRGIPVQRELAKQFGVSEAEVRKLVESGRIGFANLQAAMGALTSSGGQFEGMMKAQSETLMGKWSSAMDSTNSSLRRLTNTLLDAGNAKSFIDNIAVMADALGATLEPRILSVIGATDAASAAQFNWLNTMISGAETASTVIGRVADTLQMFQMGWKLLQVAATSAIEGIVKLIALPAQGIEKLVNILIDAVQSIQDLSNRILGTELTIAPANVNLTEDISAQIDIIEGVRKDFQDELAAMWEKPPSREVDRFFDDLKANIQAKAAETKKEAGVGLDSVVNPFDQIDAESKKLTQLKAGFFGHAIQDAFGIESLSKYASKIGDDLRSSAAQIINATRTPLEKMNIEIAKLEQLRNAGLLDEETFERAVTAAQQAVQQMSNADIGIGAVEKRVTAGYQGINNRLPEQQLKVAQSSNRFLQNISTTIGQSLNNVVVAQF